MPTRKISAPAQRNLQILQPLMGLFFDIDDLRLLVAGAGGIPGHGAGDTLQLEGRGGDCRLDCFAKIRSTDGSISDVGSLHRFGNRVNGIVCVGSKLVGRGTEGLFVFRDKGGNLCVAAVDSNGVMYLISLVTVSSI